MFYRLVNEKVYRWQKKSFYFENHKGLEPVPITFRVSDDKDISRQVAPEFLKLAIELYDTGKIPSGKLSEWFFCSHKGIEQFLDQREAKSDDEQWLEAWVE